MAEKDLSLDRLKKAQSVFERFRIDILDDRDKAGAVQSFEFCFELSWKTMKHILEINGLEVGSPKDTFRKAAQEKIIDDPEIWFEFQKYRNLTTHIYDEENLNLIVSNLDKFSKVFNSFIKKLNRKLK